MRKTGEWKEYPMPTGPYWDRLKNQYEKLRSDEMYAFAKSCAHCVDHADSFNRWTDTYCWLKQTLLCGSDIYRIEMCRGCQNYAKRGDAKNAPIRADH